MNFLKCVVAGVVSLAVGAVVVAFGAIIYLRFTAGPRGQVPIAAHLTTLAHTPVALIVAIALFLFGFAGEYRRN
jgi:hypothetical protein